MFWYYPMPKVALYCVPKIGRKGNIESLNPRAGTLRFQVSLMMFVACVYIAIIPIAQEKLASHKQS